MILSHPNKKNEKKKDNTKKRPEKEAPGKCGEPDVFCLDLLSAAEAMQYFFLQRYPVGGAAPHTHTCILHLPKRLNYSLLPECLHEITCYCFYKPDTGQKK